MRADSSFPNANPSQKETKNPTFSFLTNLSVFFFLFLFTFLPFFHLLDLRHLHTTHCWGFFRGELLPYIHHSIIPLSPINIKEKTPTRRQPCFSLCLPPFLHLLLFLRRGKERERKADFAMKQRLVACISIPIFFATFFPPFPFFFLPLKTTRPLSPTHHLCLATTLRSTP